MRTGIYNGDKITKEVRRRTTRTRNENRKQRPKTKQNKSKSIMKKNKHKKNNEMKITPRIHIQTRNRLQISTRCSNRKTLNTNMQLLKLWTSKIDKVENINQPRYIRNYQTTKLTDTRKDPTLIVTISNESGYPGSFLNQNRTFDTKRLTRLNPSLCSFVTKTTALIGHFMTKKF